MKKIFAFTFASLLMSIGINANAATVDPATDFVYVVNPPVESNPATVGGATAFVTMYPFVAAEVTIDSGIGNPGSGGQANLTYYFGVTGGTPGTSVPVFISTDLLTNETGAGYGFVTIDVGAGAAIRQVCTDTAQCAHSEFHGLLEVFVASGGEMSVALETSASVNTTIGGTAFASADPYIFVDPTFNLDNGNAYGIVVSDGVANVPETTPLPAALPLFASGLGAMGLVLRGRRKRETARPA